MAGSPRLSFQAPSATVAVNAPLTVTLQAENLADLFSAPVRLKFDPKVLRVTSVQAGSLMSGDGQKIDFTPQVVNETGDVAVNISRSPGTGGVSGSGTVLTVAFQAIGKGSTKVQVLDASFRNTQLQPVAVGSPVMAVEVQ
jgi:hypothetical protein